MTPADDPRYHMLLDHARTGVAFPALVEFCAQQYPADPKRELWLLVRAAHDQARAERQPTTPEPTMPEPAAVSLPTRPAVVRGGLFDHPARQP